ncbi:hypothetical protein SCP_0105900 [Sparassis crispa]|uniref:Uncharacterized protein n=1 Tax=Sparassis crispa TaxID=139825 RepID=A0A401G6C2_9APHY|nr:hypothetical protein SCP_0105900 [Sparassis crispa]GBE77708.1 hypothetical protein SCP_0105900 [Sparassis crispa]
MLHEVTSTLCDTCLPTLEEAISSNATEPSAKRHKSSEEVETVPREPGTGGLGIVPVRDATKKQEKTHHGKRGKQTKPDASASSTHSLHPSLSHHSTDAMVSPAWSEVLAAVSPLPAPVKVATYFFPLPFLFSGDGDKIRQYLHSYVHIRGFCHQRLLDLTIGRLPLKIAEWRDGLWGDYGLDERLEGPAVDSTNSVDGGAMSASIVRTTSTSLEHVGAKVNEKHERQQNIRQLFAHSGLMSSYDETVMPHWGFDLVSLAQAETFHAHILWEVHETNWRCELVALDVKLSSSASWGSLQRSHWERQAQVAKVWDSSLFSSAFSVAPAWKQDAAMFCWVPADKEGWEKCWPNLSSFIALAARWPNLPEVLSIYFVLGYPCLNPNCAQLIPISILTMHRTNPQVKAIVNGLLPSRQLLRTSVTMCTVSPAISHLVATSYGVTNACTLGLMFEICTHLTKCLRHLKLLAVQLSPAQAQQCRHEVNALDPPAVLGGADLLPSSSPPATPSMRVPLTPSTLHGSQRSSDSYAPSSPSISSSLSGSHDPTLIAAWGIRRAEYLEFAFKQRAIIDALGIDDGDELSYQQFCPHLRQFIDYPKHTHKQYFLPGDIPIYRVKGSDWMPSVERIDAIGRNVNLNSSSGAGPSGCGGARKHALSDAPDNRRRKVVVKAKKPVDCDIELTDNELDSEIVEIDEGREIIYVF